MGQDDWVYREPEREQPRRQDPRLRPPAIPPGFEQGTPPRDPPRPDRYERPAFRGQGYGQPPQGPGSPRQGFPGPGGYGQEARPAPSFTPPPAAPPPKAPAPRTAPKPPAAAPAKEKTPAWPAGCGCLAILAAASLITWFVVSSGSPDPSDLPVLSPYEQAVNTMTANCTQPSGQIEDAVSSAYSTLAKAGVKNLTVASVATGMADLTAGNDSPQDCSDEFSLYVQQQEGH